MMYRRLTPHEPRSPETLSAASRGGPVETLARTLWGEARGEPVAGIEAVASVVLNRARQGGWWGRSIEEVCRKPFQFSCWNVGDPNRARLLAVTAEDPVFATCLRVARRAVAGVLPDQTGGATHYHADRVSPPWARGRAPCATVGNHFFYKDVE